MRRIGLVAAAGAALGLAGAALGQGADFASATVLNIGTNNPTTVSGAVSFNAFAPGQELFRVSGQEIVAGVGATFPVFVPAGGFSAGTEPSAGLATVDTFLTQYEAGTTTIVASNDDGGPGLYSLINGTSAGATFDFEVRGFSSSSNGFYDFFVSTVGGPIPDVTGQWWAFTGLTPGGMFEAETMLGTLSDTVMAAWDSTGALLGSDDDGGSGLASLLSGTVPADGTVYISVSGYHGFSGQGTQAYYTTGGDDTGDFTLRFIPTPGSFALLGLGGLMAVRRRR